MSHRTQDIIFGALLPHTTMPSARRHLAVYPLGYCHRKKHKLSTTKATAQLHTSYTLEEFRTRPTPARPTSTKSYAPSFSYRLGSPDTSDATRNTRRRPISTPLVAALEQYWRRVEFVAILIGHAGTTLTRTLDHLIAAFSTVCLRVDHTSANNGVTLPIADFNAKSHDYRLFESLPDALADLAQSRLLDILRNKKRLVEALPGAVRGNRAHATATPTHAHAAAQQRADITLHRTRTTRVPESTAITNFGTPALWNCIPHVGTDVLHFTLFVRGLFLSLFLQEIRNA